MIFRTSKARAKASNAKALLLAAGFLLTFAPPALAQSAPADDEDQDAPAAMEDSAPSVNDEDVLKDIDISRLDWSQLNVDASRLATDRPPRRGPRALPLTAA